MSDIEIQINPSEKTEPKAEHHSKPQHQGFAQKMQRDPEGRKVFVEKQHLDLEIERLQLLLEDFYYQKNQIQQKLGNIVNEKRLYLTKNKQKINQQNSLRTTFKEYQLEQKEIQKEIEDLQGKVLKLQEQFKTKNPSAEKIQSQIEECENYREHTSLTKQEELEIKAKIQKLTSMKSLVDDYKVAFMLHEKKKDQLKQLKEKTNAAFTEMNESYEKNKNSQFEHGEDIGKYKQDLDQLQNQVVTTKEMINKKYSQRKELQQKLNQISERIDLAAGEQPESRPRRTQQKPKQKKPEKQNGSENNENIDIVIEDVKQQDNKEPVEKKKNTKGKSDDAKQEKKQKGKTEQKQEKNQKKEEELIIEIAPGDEPLEDAPGLM